MDNVRRMLDLHDDAHGIGLQQVARIVTIDRIRRTGRNVNADRLVTALTQGLQEEAGNKAARTRHQNSPTSRRQSNFSFTCRIHAYILSNSFVTVRMLANALQFNRRYGSIPDI